MSNNMPPERTGVSNGKDAPREIFKKPHLEPPQIIEKLRKQGMIVDPRTALPYLQTVGAYRMKGYWYQWQDLNTKAFHEGAHFDQVIERYEFDRELRRLVADQLERVELAARVCISNVLSKYEGPHWFLNEQLFKLDDPDNGARKKSFLAKVTDEVQWMAHKPFIAHYRSKYSQPELPPSWAISECLSFGSWSTAYAKLNVPSYKKEISRRFRVEDVRVFTSWLHAMSVMRNTVAHHGRILGAMTSVTPQSYRQRDLSFSSDQARTFFVTATVLNYLCASIKHGSGLKAALLDLFARYPRVPVCEGLGFPPDWCEHPVWQGGIARSSQSGRR